MNLLRRPLSEYVLLAAGLLYVLSLCLPSLILEPNQRGVSYVLGISLYFNGWLGLLEGLVAWLANVFALFALAQIKFSTTGKYRLGLALSILAFVAGLDSFFALGKELYFDEGGSGALIISLGTGYYLWQISFAFLVLYCCLKVRRPFEILKTAFVTIVGAGIMSFLAYTLVVNSPYNDGSSKSAYPFMEELRPTIADCVNKSLEINETHQGPICAGAKVWPNPPRGWSYATRSDYLFTVQNKKGDWVSCTKESCVGYRL